MSITVIVSFEVEDFDRWKVGFESRQDRRNESEIVAHPYRDMDKPNHVVILGTAPSREKFQEFFANPLQQASRTDSGVRGAPNVTFLES
jgi:hypothetical protein